MQNYNIEFYSKNNGEEPAREFILGLGPKMQAKTQKTPKKEIELAKKYCKDYEGRLHDE